MGGCLLPVCIFPRLVSWGCGLVSGCLGCGACFPLLVAARLRSGMVTCCLACVVLWCVVSAHMSATLCRVPMPYPTDASHTCAARVPRSCVGCLVALLPSPPMADRMRGRYHPKGRRIRPTRLAKPTSGWGRGRVPMGGDPHYPEFTTPSSVYDTILSLRHHPQFTTPS
jgi:hypothetical protein